MFGTAIPSVLKVEGYTAISTQRALENIKARLEENLPEGPISDRDQIAFDDLEVLLAAIER